MWYSVFIMLYKVVLTFKSADETLTDLTKCVTIQIKAIEQYFHV